MGSEDLVVLLQLLLALLSKGNGLYTLSLSRSVTPGNVMEVAHGVDLHDVDESWHHEEVGNQAQEVVFDVLEEVKGPQDDGYQENHRYYHARKDQD